MYTQESWTFHFCLLLAHALLTRCRRKSERPAQRVKKPATTIMMMVTGKGPFFSVDRAASQPLQKRPEVR